MGAGLDNPCGDYPARLSDGSNPFDFSRGFFFLENIFCL